jgi:hypothetical protein
VKYHIRHDKITDILSKNLLEKQKIVPLTDSGIEKVEAHLGR